MDDESFLGFIIVVKFGDELVMVVLMDYFELDVWDVSCGFGFGNLDELSYLDLI